MQAKEEPNSTVNAKPITDEEFYRLYKPVRNTLRLYEPLSVLSASLGVLFRPEAKQVDQIRKQPWIHLVLLKWAFMDEEVVRRGRPKINEAQFDRLLNRVYKLSWVGRKPSQFEDLTLFFRAVAAQQFLYQQSINLDAVARQNELFLDVSFDHFFQTAFLKVAGLPLASFVKISLCLMSHFMDEDSPPVFKRDFFAPIEHEIAPQDVDAFLRNISINIGDLPGKLRASDSKRRRVTEFLEETPFLEFPLIRSSDNYCCVYPQILTSNLGHFIFDTLKKADHEKFRLHFGRRFEAYIGRLIASSNLNYSDEKALKNKLGSKGKVVDFLIVDGDANIYIEAKAVEMATRGKATHLKEVVRGATTSSLIKAVDQVHATNKQIAEATNLDPIVKARTENYLIVVTYKELYIGNGISLGSAIGEDALNRILDFYPPHLRIPPHRMFFLTIEELEKLLQLVKEKRIGLLDALKRAESADSSPITRKFMFAQHLADWPESVDMPSPHAEKFVPIIDGLINAFRS